MAQFLEWKIIEGPRWVQEAHDFLSLPLLVRPNSVIPVGKHNDRPDYDYSDGVTLQIYQLEAGNQRVEIPNVDGKIETSFEVKREGKTIHIQRQGSSKAWNVMLAGIDSIESLENAEMEIVNDSTLIKISSDASELNIQLR